MGLKCKILLFAASPLFNDNEPYCNENPQIAIDNKQAWFGGYNAEWWNRCWTACDDFFKELNKSGFYSLIQPESATPAAYRSAFNKASFARRIRNCLSLRVSSASTTGIGGIIGVNG